jgi:outer membrane protein assembly factor BamE
MLDELKEGMTQRQVAYIMGTPLIKSPYDQDRWDYRYTLERRDEIVKSYHVAIFFTDKLYTHYKGEVPSDKIEEGQQEVLEEKKENKLLEIPQD